jgi:hypothetical protein
MGGPMSDYRLGRIFHREYEAEVSCYWGRDLAHEERLSLIKRAKRLLGRADHWLHRVRCATARVGLSPDGCQAVR